MIVNIKTRNDALTLIEFKNATEDHQQRVLLLGQALYNEFSAEFTNLTYELVTQFLRLHDHSKTSILPDGTNQIESLYEFYGINKSDLAENEKFKILSTINYINYLDSQKALEFFNSVHLISETGELTETANDLLLIERISDMVDRGENISSTKEFNRKLIPASEILGSENHGNEKWASYAHFLEKNYSTITEKK
jgi:hypothetical protein